VNENKNKMVILFWLLFFAATCLFFLFPPWQTYTNRLYGFQIEFPKEFNLAVDNHASGADFSIKDRAREHEYFHISIYKKPADYKEPTGPFPVQYKSERAASEISPDSLNGIPGFRSGGAVEGGGGFFNYFSFVKGDNIWYVDLNLAMPTYDFYGQSQDSPLDQRIYQKIKDSFKVYSSN
jgi:hypothetical protein